HVWPDPPPAARPDKRPAVVPVHAADCRLLFRLRGGRAGPPGRIPARPATGPTGAGPGPGRGVAASPGRQAGPDAGEPPAALAVRLRGAAGRGGVLDGGRAEGGGGGVPDPQAGGGDPPGNRGADPARAGPARPGPAAGPASARRHRRLPALPLPLTGWV